MDFTEKRPRLVGNRRYFFALAAFGITWMMSAWRVSPFALWAGDYATVQGLSGRAVGVEGIITATLAGAFRLLPLGTPTQRLSMVAAFGAAWTAWFAFRLAHQALERDPVESWTRCWLALATSQLACLGAVVQGAATTPSGPTIGGAAAVAAIWLIVRYVHSTPGSSGESLGASARGSALLLGSAVAVCWLESLLVGLFVTLALVIVVMLEPAAFSKAARQWLMVGASASVAVVGLPWYFSRPDLRTSSVAHSALSSLGTLRPFSDHAQRMGSWVATLGPTWFVVAVVGMVLAMLSRERRRSYWLVVALGLAFVLVPDVASGIGPGCSAVRIAATTLLCVAASKGLREIIHWATHRRPSALALATTLGVLSLVVTVLARNEDATFASDHYRAVSAEVWTEEALAVLPARAIILARTQPIVERLVAAQVSEGRRPDVLVVALEHSTEPNFVDLLLSAEPALAAVLRDLAISGRPSENAMSGLADVRPLFVEFDGSWDPRLREHLLVQPFFHRVLSQTLGRSDRAAALPAGQRAVTRVMEFAAITQPQTGLTHLQSVDEAVTREILGLRLREQLTLLLALGDRAGFETVAAGYEAAFRQSSWMSQLRLRLGATNRSIDAFDLLYQHNPANFGLTDSSQSRRKG